MRLTTETDRGGCTCGGGGRWRPLPFIGGLALLVGALASCGIAAAELVEADNVVDKTVCAAPPQPLPEAAVALEEMDLATYTDQYISRIQRRIQDNWLIPEKNLTNFNCVVFVRQRSDGCVQHAAVLNCGTDINLIRSVLSAVNRSSPLPLPKYPQVFDSELVLTFRMD